jgi:hypothetical protein
MKNAHNLLFSVLDARERGSSFISILNIYLPTGWRNAEIRIGAPARPGRTIPGRTGDVTDPGDESVFKNTNAGTHCLGDNAQRRARNAHAHI